MSEMALVHDLGSGAAGSVLAFEVAYTLVTDRQEECDQLLDRARHEHGEDPMVATADLFARIFRARWDGVDQIHHRLCSVVDGNPLAFVFHAYVASLLARLRMDARLASDVGALLTAGRNHDVQDWISLANRRAAEANALVARGKVREAAQTVTCAVDDAERYGHVGLTQKIADHVGTLLDAGPEFRRVAERLGALLDEALSREPTATAVLHVRWKDALLRDDPELHRQTILSCTGTAALLDRGEILERAADCLQRHGDQTAAITLLREAASWYEHAHGWPALSRVRGQLRRHGVRLAGPKTAAYPTGDSRTDQLTAAEHAIADLARAGLSNVAIGRRLSISTGTVGTHLSRVYRKLGIASRAQLSSPD